MVRCPPTIANPISLTAKIPVRKHTWLAARAEASDHDPAVRHADARGHGIMAHTSPIYIASGDRWTMHEPATAQHMITLVDVALAHVREMTLRYRGGDVWHRHGEVDHQAYLERPFHEAHAALHARQAHHHHGE